tara:strand:+ start:1887 stop:2774 length:888 start_codon:yes stop_codon:yes gene_type:complete
MKLNGVKYWKPHFSDLKIFDKISLYELLYRVESTFREFEEYNRGSLIYYSDDYKDIPVMKDLYNKFNIDNSEDQVCLYPDGQPLFREKYGDYKIGGTCNYQYRDNALKSPFEHLCLYEHHYLEILKNNIESKYLYITIPNELILKYMETTSNKDDEGNRWNMEIPRKFIGEINNWDDLEEIEIKIDEFDKKYPNWNHDFPILGFRSVLQNGLLFPNTNFFITKILVAGTHRMFMCSMSGNDYPIITQIPKGKRQFTFVSKEKNFKNNSNLKIDIDLDKKQYTLFLNEKQIGVVQG